MPKKSKITNTATATGDGEPVAPRPERDIKRSELSLLIGQEVSITWGLASQQKKETATGTLESVTDRAAELFPRGQHHSRRTVLPLSWIVRYAQ
jgi:hypothetical protein